MSPFGLIFRIKDRGSSAKKDALQLCGYYGSLEIDINRGGLSKSERHVTLSGVIQFRRICPLFQVRQAIRTSSLVTIRFYVQG
jgi:hypothetical protein